MYNQPEICKARTLFITRGILNRDVIPDHIIYSWVRSKLHNISFEILNTDQPVDNINLLSLDKSATEIMSFLRKLNTEMSRIYLISDTGKVLYNTQQNNLNLPNFTSFSEVVVGTTAAGISLNTGENVAVYGCEHYNKSMINYISESFIVEGDYDKSYIILVLTPIRQSVSHQRLFKLILDKYSKEKEKSAVLTDDSEKKLENTTVNTVKSREIRHKNDIDESSSKAYDINVCKEFTLKVVEKNTIEAALKHFKWNLKKASEALGIGRSTLYRKLKEYDIEKD